MIASSIKAISKDCKEGNSLAGSIKPLEAMKMSVFFDIVIFPQKGDTLKEGKNYISKCLFYNSEKLNQSRCYMGKFLILTIYIW